MSELTLSNGLHYLGAPWHSLIIYPGTMQNMVFSSDDSPSDELHTRTADGLQVVLEVTFQYQLSVGELHGLFEDYGQDFAPVYFDVASHLISEGATLYTAYEFFNSKEAIAASLQVSEAQKGRRGAERRRVTARISPLPSSRLAHLSISLSLYLSISLSIHLSLSLSLTLSIYLFIYLFLTEEAERIFHAAPARDRREPPDSVMPPARRVQSSHHRHGHAEAKCESKAGVR